jgi:hypothetical protein
MSETEDLARQALAEMDSINAMLKILVNPKKYKDLYDALTNHLAEIVRHHEQISEECKAAQSALADASKLSSENESRSAEHNETTEKLASWEADLKQREGALKQGNVELQRNLSE